MGKPPLRAHAATLAPQRATFDTHFGPFSRDSSRVHGPLPTYRVLKNWQAFRMSIERGKRATRPQYAASEDQMTELVRSRRPEEALEAWMAPLGSTSSGVLSSDSPIESSSIHIGPKSLPIVMIRRRHWSAWRGSKVGAGSWMLR
jgi:hypothetical protein